MYFKEARDKYGRIKVSSLDKYKWQQLSSRYAEENLSCRLSIPQNTDLQQEWVRQIREKIRFDELGI